MKKKDLLLILAIFALIAVMNAPKVEAKSLDLAESKTTYYKELSYEKWRDVHENKIKKLQTKMNKMTQERFNKMKEMQINYWNNNNS
ncbi:MAG: hypothetical protein PHY30_01670 [Candidatus Pacebacteria bacterium]|nr:hypothetical protein [Candidatus Paceibacterota bacterium]